ncbi:aldehyde dehydrogenase family protein [Teladorsagia circumcincta]|uniref:Aldehyde dehydrogenase family protein n=1 Tax=Teladorsagia circumcincta TaxID=45464 RepID=A0A2G9UXZ6_TELCI|nr:aldehyde dehydrogenase family protein [Teladorsagia circumcincta]
MLSVKGPLLSLRYSSGFASPLLPKGALAYINGEWVHSKKKTTFDVTNPYTGDLLYKTANCDVEEAKSGKPLVEARGEIKYSAGFFDWYSGEARRIYGQVVTPAVLNREHIHIREPIGVGVLITPWNFPTAMIARKAGAALAAGCTLLVKPASDTPLSALALAQLLLAQSASTVKRVCLELGGSAPFLVFDSADLDVVVKGAMGAKFRGSGQTCVAANRFFVQQKIHDDFVTKMTVAMKGLVVGDGMNPKTTIGHTVLFQIDGLLKDAVAKGAKVVLGGKRGKGTCFQPTLLTNVTNEMDIAHTEIFGPVVAIRKFTDEASALNAANDTRMGLAGYVFSRDPAQIYRVTRRLQVGMIGVNEGLMSCAEAAFGGVKESGLGREGAAQGIDEFTQWKYICTQH